MSGNPQDAAATSHLPGTFWRVPYMLWLSALIAMVFSLCIIVNSQANSDGTWLLYADLFRGGHHLYSELRVPLQPFFVLETVYWRSLFGDAWFGVLALSIIHSVILIYGYTRLVNISNWPEFDKAILLLGAYVTAVSFQFFRFDDYHVISDSLAIYVVLILAHLIRDGVPAGQLRYTALLGALCGVAFTTRANDGIFLYAGVVAIVWRVATGRRLFAVMSVTAFFLLAISVVVLLTGDSPLAYARYSLLSVSQIKGGNNQVALAPVKLLRDIVTFDAKSSFLFGFAFISFIWLSAITILYMVRARWFIDRPWPSLLLSAALVTFCALVIMFTEAVVPTYFVWVLSPTLMFVLIAVGSYAALAALFVVKVRNPMTLLTLIPAGMLVSFSMSSGGYFIGLYAPVGLFIAILPLFLPASSLGLWVRGAFFATNVALASSGVMSKMALPLWWQYYVAPPMFTQREWVKNPRYGYIIVDTRSKAFFDGVCGVLGADGHGELLSMPFSYANYYCNITPWHQYVQTFFDTSNPMVIGHLNDELKTAPPRFILYERQLRILRLHELFFNDGKPAPHRALDGLIMNEIKAGAWSIVLRKRMYGGWDDWLLIRTSPDARQAS